MPLFSERRARRLVFRSNCGSKSIPGEDSGVFIAGGGERNQKDWRGKNLFACTRKGGGIQSKTGQLQLWGDGCRGKLPAYMDVQDGQIVFDNPGLFLYDKNGKSGIRAA